MKWNIFNENDNKQNNTKKKNDKQQINPAVKLDKISLIVNEPHPSNVGRGIITLDNKTKNELGLNLGDFVEIIGTKKTAAKIQSAKQEDEGKGLIGMDNLIRRNAGVALGDKVNVRKADFSEAERIVFAPTQDVRIIASGYDRILKKNFIGRPMNKGDQVLVSFFGSGFIYNVIKTNPEGIVKITDFTQFVLLEEMKEDTLQAETYSYEKLYGMDKQLNEAREAIELPLKHPELHNNFGISNSKGVLFYGPSGTGKTSLAKAICGENDVHLIFISSPSVMSKYVGESEERIREVFKEAKKNAPAIICFDEFDAIAKNRDKVAEAEGRVSSQLLSEMDQLRSNEKIIVLALTNRIESIDPAFRTPARFGIEIEFTLPDKNSRLKILESISQSIPFSDKTDLAFYAENTEGFTGADIIDLARIAAKLALRRLLPNLKLEEESIPPEVLATLKINKNDLEEALIEKKLLLNKISPKKLKNSQKKI